MALLALYLGLLDGPVKLAIGAHELTASVRNVLIGAVVLGALMRIVVRREKVKLPPLSGWVIAFVTVVADRGVQSADTEGILKILGGFRQQLQWVPFFFFGYLLMRSKKRLRQLFLIVGVIGLANGVVSRLPDEPQPRADRCWGPGYRQLIFPTQGTRARPTRAKAKRGCARPRSARRRARRRHRRARAALQPGPARRDAVATKMDTRDPVPRGDGRDRHRPRTIAGRGRGPGGGRVRGSRLPGGAARHAHDRHAARDHHHRCADGPAAGVSAAQRHVQALRKHRHLVLDHAAQGRRAVADPALPPGRAVRARTRERGAGVGPRRAHDQRDRRTPPDIRDPVQLHSGRIGRPGPGALGGAVAVHRGDHRERACGA